MLRLLVFLTALILLSSVSSVSASVFEPQEEGQINLVQRGNASFDTYTRNPSPAQQTWMSNHYWRMIAHAPYFDSRLSWYPNAWAYFDVAAVYPDRDISLMQSHPNWVYKDGLGNKLYIPWNCSGGTCPQYAGNIGNPGFRAFRISQMRQKIVSKGYRGLWLDDVNMLQRTSNGEGVAVAAIDPHTGQPMTLANWRQYMATYMEEVRQAFPDIEIVHNGLWFADQNFNEPNINRQIRAADYFNAERGSTDKGLTGGEGRFAYKTFLRFMDHVHSLNRGVLLMERGKTLQEREFGLASWLLMSAGIDMIASGNFAWTVPESYWFGYDINLGRAKGARYETAQDLIRRDFECGSVILNPPDASVRSLGLNENLTDLNGNTVSFIQLEERTAVVLRKPCEPSTLQLKGSLVSVQVDHNRQQVSFPALTNPVVIIAAPSHRGPDPGVIRLQNINKGGFNLQFQEWEYGDKKHTKEFVSYLALEAGRYDLEGEGMIEVGSFDLNDTGQFNKQIFSAPFPGKPALFLTIQTLHGHQAVTVRARHVSKTNFEAALYEQESLMDGHAGEKIGYLAIYTNKPVGSINIGSHSVPYERRRVFIGDAWVNVVGSSVKLQEERSADQEILHTLEIVDVLRLGGHVFVQDVSSYGGDTVAPRRNY